MQYPAIHEGIKKWENENLRMGRNSVTGIPGIVPQEGINRSGIGKKNSRVKWGFTKQTEL